MKSDDRSSRRLYPRQESSMSYMPSLASQVRRRAPGDGKVEPSNVATLSTEDIRISTYPAEVARLLRSFDPHRLSDCIQTPHRSRTPVLRLYVSPCAWLWIARRTSSQRRRSRGRSRGSRTMATAPRLPATPSSPTPCVRPQALHLLADADIGARPPTHRGAPRCVRSVPIAPRPFT